MTTAAGPDTAADGTAARGTALEMTETIAAPRDLVFAYFTDPARYAQWMGVEARLDPRPDGVYLVHMDGAEVVAEGRFVQVEPPERVVFTFGWRGSPTVPPGSTRVEITLTEHDGQTLLHLRHSGLPDPEAVSQHGEGWARYVARLGIVATGGEPGPEPTTVPPDHG